MKPCVMYSRCVGSEIEMPNKVLSTLLSVTVSKIRHVLLSKYIQGLPFVVLFMGLRVALRA